MKLVDVDPNILLYYALIIYRLSILIFDILIFLFMSIFEYGKLCYNFFVPREKQSIVGYTALITGAGHGIGKQIALELAKNGAHVVCLDIVDEGCLKTVEEIHKMYPHIRTYSYKCDVSNRLNIEKIWQIIQEDAGNIDIIINNAGILCCKPFIQHNSKQIEKLITTNLLGQLWILRAALPKMITQDKGFIVSMSSFAGHAGVPNMVPYSASKFGIRGMMEALYIELRQENRDHGVHLMTVSPFLVDTGMIKSRRIRFPGVLDIVTPKNAAEIIISNMRQGNAIVFIPNILYYLMAIIRILPSRVQLYITDFLDSGIGIDYNND